MDKWFYKKKAGKATAIEISFFFQHVREFADTSTHVYTYWTRGTCLALFHIDFRIHASPDQIILPIGNYISLSHLFSDISNIFLFLNRFSYLHCLGRKLSSDNKELIRFSSLFAPAVGLRTVILPTTEHGSVPFFPIPMHHPPGAIMPRPRNRSSESILSSTGSSWWNFLANGALLSTILCMSSTLR